MPVTVKYSTLIPRATQTQICAFVSIHYGLPLKKSIDESLRNNSDAFISEYWWLKCERVLCPHFIRV